MQYASSGIRNHGPSVRAIESSICLRPRGHSDKLHDEDDYNNDDNLILIYLRANSTAQGPITERAQMLKQTTHTK
jgi:hypothetical protein